jgi:hypothetical protein
MPDRDCAEFLRKSRLLVLRVSLRSIPASRAATAPCDLDIVTGNGDDCNLAHRLPFFTADRKRRLFTWNSRLKGQRFTTGA